MKLKLRRTAKKSKYTIGHLYMQDKQNGEWVRIADTIEDKDRGLDQSMTEANIAAIKVKHQTAIPTGKYEIDMNTVSGTFVKKDTYKAFCGGKVPRLKNVKGFSGILIHIGTDQDSSSGCIAGGIKEWCDNTYNWVWSWRDLAWTCLGAVLAAVFIALLHVAKG